MNDERVLLGQHEAERREAIVPHDWRSLFVVLGARSFRGCILLCFFLHSGSRHPLGNAWFSETKRFLSHVTCGCESVRPSVIYPSVDKFQQSILVISTA